MSDTNVAVFLPPSRTWGVGMFVEKDMLILKQRLGSNGTRNFTCIANGSFSSLTAMLRAGHSEGN